MLFFSEKDIRKAAGLDAAMDVVEGAYRVFASGRHNIPDRQVVENGSDSMIFMPCFLDNCFGAKILTLFPGNPKKGLPFIQGIVMLNDAENGKTLAILDGTFLTTLRTGAVGGVGIRCFAQKNAKSVGIIGAGTQGMFQAVFACAAREIEDIFLFDIADKDWDAYINTLKAELTGRMPRIHVCQRVEDLVRSSHIVVTATPSTKPVMPDDPELLRGKCFIAIGSFKPEMREIPDAIWKLVDHVYTELPYAIKESGDLSVPLSEGLIKKEQVRFIGDLLTETPRPTPPESGTTTYFKSVGMGLLDLSLAKFTYDAINRT